MSERADLMRMAHALHKARQGAKAAELYEQVLASEPGHADALHLLGVARGESGDPLAAAALIRRAIDQQGNIGLYHLNLARALGRLGDREGEIVSLRRAVDLDERDDIARDLLSRRLLPGEPYLTLLEKFHELLRPASYVEIGVESGRSLALARPPTRSIGIDPAPHIAAAMSASTKIFKLTSDDFFARHDLAKELDQPSVELAFIDGLHLFEQALRDFINLERYAGKRSVYLVHDCLPLDAASAARERRGEFWTGDVWKLIPALRAWRPDLAIRTIATQPSGLAVITGLDATSAVLAQNFAAIVDQFMARPAPLEQAAQIEQLARIENDWAAIKGQFDAVG